MHWHFYYLTKLTLNKLLDTYQVLTTILAVDHLLVLGVILYLLVKQKKKKCVSLSLHSLPLHGPINVTDLNIY